MEMILYEYKKVDELQLMKILIGTIFIFSGSLLFGLVHAAITIHAVGYTIDHFFYNLYWTRNLVPYILGIVQLIVGFVLIVLGLKSGKEAASEQESEV